MIRHDSHVPSFRPPFGRSLGLSYSSRAPGHLILFSFPNIKRPREFPFEEEAVWLWETMADTKIVVVGAGPVGSLAALYAAKRGHQVEVYELRPGKCLQCFFFFFPSAYRESDTSELGLVLLQHSCLGNRHFLARGFLAILFSDSFSQLTRHCVVVWLFSKSLTTSIWFITCFQQLR